MTKRKGQYRQWTKLAALAALERNGGSFYQTEKETGIRAPTLRRWAKARQSTEMPQSSDEARPQPDLAQSDCDEALDERLEQLARQMVEVMPEKVDEANLQELARALSIVLATMNQTRTDKEKTSHAREKLAEILERYAATGGEAGTPESADG